MNLIVWFLRRFIYVRNLERRIEELKKMSHKDRLTGILNAVGITTFVSSRIAALENQFESDDKRLRDYTNLSIVYIDLDNFKKINDTMGHEFADEMLKAFVRFMQKHIRVGEDTVGRWYRGDEFVLIISEMPHARVAKKVAHLQDLLDGGALRISSRDPLLTFSFGVASVFEGDGARANLDFKLLRAIGDERMRVDKRRRKGC